LQNGTGICIIDKDVGGQASLYLYASKEGMLVPIVTLKLWPGRTEAERMACARAVATAITETLENMENEPMIVSVLEMPADELDQAATAASEGFDAGTLVIS